MTICTSSLTGGTLTRIPPISLLEYKAPEIDLHELTPGGLLHKSGSSLIFRARWQEKDCVLKIYHYRKKCRADPVNREVDPYLCESRAYCRLKAYGLCDQGHIPDFYGVIQNIEPKTEGWESHLEAFLEDHALPNAVLLEFIPNLQTFEFETFTTERAEQLSFTLAEMHKARVFFGDLYSRNVKVQPETNRALFIDFDHAQTFPLITRKKRQRKRMHEWMKGEEGVFSEVLVTLAEDHKRGKIWWSWWWHYDEFDPPGWTEVDEAARIAAIKAANSVDSAEAKRAREADNAIDGEYARKKQKITGTGGMNGIIRPAEEENKEPKEHSHPLSTPNLRGELCAQSLATYV